MENEILKTIQARRMIWKRPGTSQTWYKNLHVPDGKSDKRAGAASYCSLVSLPIKMAPHWLLEAGAQAQVVVLV